MTAAGARNGACTCGSGLKYKKCCLAKEQLRSQLEATIRSNIEAALTLRADGKHADAEYILQEVLRASPGHPDALHWLGVIAQDAQLFDVAEDLITHAIAAAPDAQKYHNLGIVYRKTGKRERAVNCFLHALRLKPDYAAAHNSLGVLYQDMGESENAARHLKLAQAGAMPDAAALFNLGVTLQAMGRHTDAEEQYRKAIEVDPRHVAAHNNLGMMLREQRNEDGARDEYLKALALNPDYPEAHNNLAGLLKDQGHLDAAIAEYKKAITLKPDFLQAHSNLLFTMLYSPRTSPDDLASAFAGFRARFEDPLRETWQPHPNAPDPDRRLRIGYVSGDFWGHAVSFFIEPVIASHDRSRFEVFCYSNSRTDDDVTARIRSCADHFIPVYRLSNDELARRVREDSIDILVDLSNHSAGNRLMAFARKPAPVQVTWIGLPCTTGLNSIDYRFTDHHLDPPGMTEAHHTEKLVRLPISSPYLPPDVSPDVNELPALRAGSLTFSCLNNLAKVTDEALTLWATILARTPGSRLILANTDSAAVKERLTSRFTELGVDQSRLVLKPRSTLKDYLRLHHEIDIALDPFPYNGGTTTRHSLWMGVPVITLEGRTTASRVGHSLLARYGLTSFSARDPQEYVRIAVECQQRLHELAELRAGMRKRITGSPWHAPAAATAAVEAAFIWIWADWCATAS